MCERVKKAEAVLDKYRQKAKTVHQLADMVRKDVEKLEYQLSVIQIVYMVASELSINDYEHFSQHCKEEKVAKKQEREQAFVPPGANGRKGLHLF